MPLKQVIKVFGIKSCFEHMFSVFSFCALLASLRTADLFVRRLTVGNLINMKLGSLAL